VQIADRLGRSPATIKAYFYDPTGEKARAVKARYVGVCRGCGAYTQPRNGKGDAYAYCKRCHPGAIQRKWTQELVLGAMVDWRNQYGRLPSSYDWSRTYAKRRGGVALKRLKSESGRRRASSAGFSGAGGKLVARQPQQCEVTAPGRVALRLAEPAHPPSIDARVCEALGRSLPLRDTHAVADSAMWTRAARRPRYPGPASARSSPCLTGVCVG
jgi:hypothetical protein